MCNYNDEEIAKMKPLCEDMNNHDEMKNDKEGLKKAIEFQEKTNESESEE